MRLGIYNPAVGTRYSGGTETFLREMIRKLSADHDVTVFTGRGEIVPELDDIDVDIVQFPWIDKSRRWSTFARALTVDQMLPAEVESLSLFGGSGFGRRIDTDAIDVLSTHYYLDNVLLSRSLDLPTMFRFPGIRRPSPRWKAMASVARPSVYVSNSETTARRVKKWLGIEVDGTVYAGVDTSRFAPDATPAVDTDEFTVLFVGRLDPGKGLDELLEAVARVRDGGPLVDLLLVGDGILRDELEARASDLGLAGAVTFAGEVPHSEIHRYYVSCDVFCLPSIHEGFPIVNVEAMASGRPVVSTRIPAVEEQIDDGQEGILVDVGDVGGLADAFARLADDPMLRDRLGTAGREKAVDQFGWTVQATRMEELYEKARRQG